jgi:cytidylate kinase
MKTTRKIIVAVDGYSSTGKSTLAKKLAKKLGFIYIDTGAMYRAVSIYAMKNGFIENGDLDKEALISKLKEINLDFHYNSKLEFSEMFLNGINVEKEIRSIEVSNVVSKVAAVSEVRKKLVDQQRKMAVNKSIVMDGRDIGTVVFPKADMKIFMIATAEKRAQRRFKEMKDKGIEISYDAVLQNVNERDLADTTRKDSPLIKAMDAVEIDNSDLNANQTFEKVFNYIEKNM